MGEDPMTTTTGGRAARPTSDADWTAWSDQRQVEMQPLADRRAQIEQDMATLNAGGDYSRAREVEYRSLENDRDILDTDVRTTLPPHLADSGHFEPGDFRGYLDERSEGGYASMSPEQQREYIRQLRPEYEQARAQEAARRDGEQMLPGAAGRALGDTLAQMTTLALMARGRGRAQGCRTCAPAARPLPAEPEVTLYRGIQVVRGQPVQGARPGQMASTDPRDAFHYGLNPPGARPPPGANELVVMRFRVPRSRTYDPDPRPAPAGTTEHLIVEGVDITKLPGYREIRVPLSSVSGPMEVERMYRPPREDAVARLTETLRAP